MKFCFPCFFEENQEKTVGIVLPINAKKKHFSNEKMENK